MDISCVRPTRNSNLPKRLYSDVSNGKANKSPDSCQPNEWKQYRKINRHVELFRTLNFIGFYGLTHFDPVSHLYPLETSESRRFSDVFKGKRLSLTSLVSRLYTIK